MHPSPEKAIRAILEKNGVEPTDLLGRGMEAEVYVYRSESVLKIHLRLTTLDSLYTLQDFYASLDASRMSYRLPRIRAVLLEEGLPVTIEERLPGRCLQSLMPELSPAQMEALLPRYLEAVLELQQAAFPHP